MNQANYLKQTNEIKLGEWGYSGERVENGEWGHFKKKSAHFSNDIVQLCICEVLVHLLQDLTEPQHWNEPLSFTVKEPEKFALWPFFGEVFLSPERLFQFIIGEV